jgi:phytoene synthase
LAIFKKGSKTYYNSTRFFPAAVREDVSKLYAFVRVVDDFVDCVPQRAKEFHEFKRTYLEARNGKKANDVVIDSFVELADRKGFRNEWVDAFLFSMESDLVKDSYETLEELNTYLYGSAEVIGLMMAKILDLPRESYGYARYLGKSMQLINFIRDIQEDIRLGRTYLPKSELKGLGLLTLSYEESASKPEEFKAFVRLQISRYREWQSIAEKGYAYIPRRYLVPIKIAAAMYKLTARRISRNPWIVYKRKVKPSKPRIVSSFVYNTMFTWSSLIRRPKGDCALPSEELW